MRVFSTERRPADQTFEHDGSDRPPVATKSIAISSEDLRCNVVGSTNGGISESPTGLTPCIDLATIANGEVDLVQRDRVTISRLVRRTLQKILVVLVVVLLLESSR